MIPAEPASPWGERSAAQLIRSRRAPAGRRKNAAQLGGRLQPGAEPLHRRERRKSLEIGQLGLELGRDLLDQKIAERDAAQPGLTVADRVEDGGIDVGGGAG